MLELAEARRKARACYDCGKCTASCPVARVGGTTSPRRHVNLAGSGDQSGALDSAALFSCLTCALCDSRCPAKVSYTELVRSLRELARDEGREPACPHGGALQSLMRMMARGATHQDRLGWLTPGLQVAPATGDVFFWSGCTPYYDAFFPELKLETLNGTRAAVRVLNALGLTPVVAADERCCGHDLLWNGDRDNFERLARHNVALVERSGAQLLVTPCAECARTWRIDYAPFLSAKPPRVLHLAELIAERASELPLRNAGAHRVTFHDPCRLGRHLGVYDAPRAALAAVPGVELAEMRRNRARAACCAGSSWSSCDRYAKALQVERLEEARATGAEVLLTACPKCQIHLRCAMRDPKLGGEIAIEIRDIAEVVAAAIDGKESR
jgi:heterodisulfide reductase subunit D